MYNFAAHFAAFSKTTVEERRYFTCTSWESNPGSWINRQTLYHVAVKAGFYHKAVEVYFIYIPGPCDIHPLLGAQWLSGRVLDSRPKGRGFEPHRRHCVVSLSKNINPSLVLVQPRKTRPFITERLLMGRKESNQTNKFTPSNLKFVPDREFLGTGIT